MRIRQSTTSDSANPQLLIDAIVRQTMVLVAELATSNGARAPLARIADQIFLDLTRELQQRGITKKVIADMFGLALRTYHRRVHDAESNHIGAPKTRREAVLNFISSSQPVSQGAIEARFRYESGEMISGALNDLVHSRLVSRTGWGEAAVYRAGADAEANAALARASTVSSIVLLTAYRNGPATPTRISELTGLPATACEAALMELEHRGLVHKLDAEGTVYSCERLDLHMDEPGEWEAAVLDHYQAMTSAICAKLAERGAGARAKDVVGGSTWSLDVWSGHPLEEEATKTLARVRQQLEELRTRVDKHNEVATADAPRQRVVIYVGQYVRGQ